MKFTPKQEFAMGELLQQCLDNTEANMKTSPDVTNPTALFMSNLLSAFDRDGVPGAIRIMLRLQMLEMRVR